MPIKDTDLLVVHRAGTDYKATVADLNIAEAANDGKLTIQNSDTSIVGEFTANQETDVVLTLAAPPVVNNGKLTVTYYEGSTLGEFTANQAGDVNIQLPQTKWDDIDGTPTTFPPSAHQHALDDLSDVNADSSKGYVLATLDDGTFGFVPPADLPTALHPLGFANVGEPCPKADPAPGDLYIHHDPNITRSEYSADDSVIADASWTGIAGETIYEGEYVVYSTDGLWHRGGGVHNVTQVQSDWNETDAASLAFIKNKPDVDNFPEAPDTGWLYVRNGLTESWVRGLPYDISSLDPLP